MNLCKQLKPLSKNGHDAIRNILLCTDDYLYLIPIFTELYNKYIREDVTILCYKTPEIELPDNFNVISLGSQDERVSWSDGIISFFQDFKESYFKLWCEDYLLYGVENSYRKAHSTILKDKNIKRILLCIPHDRRYKKIINAREKLTPYDEDFYYLKGGGKRGIDSWRTSLFTSIWETNYFKSMLKTNLTPKEFERKNRSSVIKDNQVQLVSKSNSVLFQNNVVRGKLNCQFINEFYTDEINELKASGFAIDSRIESCLLDAKGIER